MNESNSSSEYYIKHILSTEWIPAKYISNTNKHIELLIDDTDSISFEEDDKIIYSVKSKNKNYVYNTVVSDIDFPTYDKITITIEKPLERRVYSRYNVDLLSTLNRNNISESCSVIDISKNGLKITTNIELDIKEYVNLLIPFNNQQTINVHCSVIYKDFNTIYKNTKKYVYGLKIIDLSHQDKQLLKEFLDTLD